MRPGTRRVLLWGARRWPQTLLTGAALGDRWIDLAPCLRDRMLWKALEAGHTWPYPTVLNMPDVSELKPPMVLATAHIGSLLALGALIERLPSEVLVLHGSYPSRPGRVRTHSLARETELERVGGFRQALRTLRRPGFVLVAVDGTARRLVETTILGRRVPLATGPFALATRVRAPLLPVAARWEGRRIQLLVGEAIPPGPEVDMARLFAAWLEPILQRYPRESRPSLELVARWPSVLDEPATQSLMADLPVLGSGD